MKAIIITLLVLLLVGVGGYFLYQQFMNAPAPVAPEEAMETPDMQQEVIADEADGESTIGSSAEGRSIVAYHFGTTGAKEILFVGGIHGGYSPNTALVAYELVDYLKENPDKVPANTQVTVIPALNPDGLFKVVGKEGPLVAADVTENSAEGRFNGNEVDLNRNFECDWQADAVWQSTPVSGGSEVFSEPESKAMRDYVEREEPVAVVVWYSSAGGVFTSNCHRGVSEDSTALTKAYADASGYKEYQEFDFYAITGDMANWLAQEGIPAISVLLSDHTDSEWEKNQKGIEAVLAHFAE